MDGSFDTPWEQPVIKNIIDMFDGTVTNIKPLDQVQVAVGGDNDECEVHG